MSQATLMQFGFFWEMRTGSSSKEVPGRVPELEKEKSNTTHSKKIEPQYGFRKTDFKMTLSSHWVVK